MICGWDGGFDYSDILDASADARIKDLAGLSRGTTVLNIQLLNSSILRVLVPSLEVLRCRRFR